MPVITGRQLVIVGRLLIQLKDPWLIHLGWIRCHGDQDILLCQFIVLGHFDQAQYVGDTADAQEGQILQPFFWQACLFHQIIVADLRIEKAEQVLAVVVIDSDRHVGILNVVNKGNMFVADPFNAVSAKSVIQDGGALQGFTDRNLDVRKFLL